MNFLFLLYVSRSGSTMLANRMTMHLQGALALPELDLVTTMFARGEHAIASLNRPRLEKLIESDRKFSELELAEGAAREIAEASAGHGIRAVLEALVSTYTKRRKLPMPELVIFQRGSLLSVAHDIATHFPEAKFIHVYRDPRAVIRSVAEIGSGRFESFDPRHMGRRDTLGLARNWVTYVERVDALVAAHPGRVHQIRFEHLCRDLSGELNAIARFAGRNFVLEGNGGAEVGVNEREIHQNVSAAPMLDRLDAWQRELPIWRGYVTERFAAAAMHRRGYEPFFTKKCGTGLVFRAWTVAWVEFARGMLVPLRHWLGMLRSDPRGFLSYARRALRRRTSGGNV